ncbi:hypothetical protein [Paraliomyxa miuraensis]|uniref:hypothetical protein n=1 Tax=Paraliomyxa miuraensis TaxID=376150 RepID=UPI00225635D7|nr:hypothetical protein [Paraliomyxa miuraensis]MCX4246684.1 hypothetical protein [Paraliomyxa miuraensis]
MAIPQEISEWASIATGLIPVPYVGPVLEGIIKLFTKGDDIDAKMDALKDWVRAYVEGAILEQQVRRFKNLSAGWVSSLEQTASFGGDTRYTQMVAIHTDINSNAEDFLPDESHEKFATLSAATMACLVHALVLRALIDESERQRPQDQQKWQSLLKELTNKYYSHLESSIHDAIFWRAEQWYLTNYYTESVSPSGGSVSQTFWLTAKDGFTGFESGEGKYPSSPTQHENLAQQYAVAYLGYRSRSYRPAWTAFKDIIIDGLSSWRVGNPVGEYTENAAQHLDYCRRKIRDASRG